MLRQARYAFRKLSKQPGSTAVAVLAMALGIALTAGMFSIIDGLYLRGLPFEDQDEIVHLERNNLSRDIESMEVTLHDFVDWREQQTELESIAGFTSGTFNLADQDGLPERYSGSWISPSFLEILGVDPILGRGFEPEDELPGAAKVLLISHDIWQTRYGGDPDIIDRPVRINAEPATIVGVLPRDFGFPVDQSMWAPLVIDLAEVERGEGVTLEVFGRMKDGSTIDRVQTEMNVIAERLAASYPETNEGVGAVVQPYLEEFVGEMTRLLLGVMMTAVLLVLVIACFNVANLLIGRASTRSRELAIRTALGSSRWHSIQQVLAEALVIASFGAVLGVGLAYVGVDAFARSIEGNLPGFWVDIQLGPRGLVVAVAATLGAALIAGLVPALQASKPDVTEALQDTSRGSTSFRLGWVSRVLVITQVAVSAGLLVGAGLTVRSIMKVNSYDLAFETSNLLVARVGLFETDYPEEQDRVEFYDDLLTTLSERPEVARVSVGTVVPTDTATGAGGGFYERPGEEYEKVWQMPWSRRVAVSPGYFESLGVPILLGRDFGPQDHWETERVAIVNQDFADREWGDENPIGKSIDMWLGEETEAEEQNAGVVRVVGVVPNLRFAEFDNADDQHGIYLPMAQEGTRFSWVVVKTQGDPMAFVDTLRRQVLTVDPNLPLYFVRSMDQVLEESRFQQDILGSMFGTFGVVALFLACVGLFGLMSFAVTQRTQEMGVRMALGASAQSVLRMVLGQGLLQTAIGLVLGLFLGLGLGLFLSKVLFQVSGTDLVVFVGVPVALLTVAILATLWPAIRASSVDPIEALRYE